MIKKELICIWRQEGFCLPGPKGSPQWNKTIWKALSQDEPKEDIWWKFKLINEEASLRLFVAIVLHGKVSKHTDYSDKPKQFNYYLSNASCNAALILQRSSWNSQMNFNTSVREWSHEKRWSWSGLNDIEEL